MSTMGDAISLLLLPFSAAVAFVLIHAYFGVHVLRRNIVFADLALAQLSALGATVAFANGYAPASGAGFAYALLFTAIGAGLLTLTRPLAQFISQEAFVGILYVVATAATILVVDRSPQGAEHVKRILVGSILTVEPVQVLQFALLYGAIGGLHWLVRRPLLAISGGATDALRPFAVPMWDFFFFLSFGVVVTSSVTTAGVLLVFSFLIVPAVIGSIFSRSVPVVLLIAWAAGILASAVGLAASYLFDLPTGAAMVAVFGLALVLAGLVKAFMFVDEKRRSVNVRIATRAGIAFALLLVLASSVWLMVNPAGDQPLAALVETATGMGSAGFLDARDREIYDGAARDMVRFQTEVDRLDAMERTARYEGAALSDDDIRRLASYQQSFNEMTRGERFVQDVLRTKARVRERWIVGLPFAVLALFGLGMLARRLLVRFRN
ncbi:MAG: metal ABC transporter permease [Betaproteobacteria bacterium]|nr:MAG: metal ABC transporter permease [Betaproteobacteria bacterium]